LKPSIPKGSNIKVSQKGKSWVIQWQVTPERQVVTIGDLKLCPCWRNEMYDLWTLDLPAPAPILNYASPSKSSVIFKAGIASSDCINRQYRIKADW
jgi:hypothetical protein